MLALEVFLFLLMSIIMQRKVVAGESDTVLTFLSGGVSA
jgi:hypothetical protein